MHCADVESVFTCARCISISHSARRCCSTVVLSSEAGVMCSLIWLSLPQQQDVPILQLGRLPCAEERASSEKPKMAVALTFPVSAQRLVA